MPIEPTALPDNILTLSLKKAVNWCRRSSVWPLPFATACCGIELMATASSRYDLARFGAEVMRFSPRQADLMIVAGRVGIKMMPVLQRIYMQMAEPKWVISMGACASTGGVFDNYATVQGIDQFMHTAVGLAQLQHDCDPDRRAQRAQQLAGGVQNLTRRRRGIRSGPWEPRMPVGAVVVAAEQIRGRC